ncbi:hypothetical protein PN473_02725 [Dolichospermum circinale CS-545/17]|nr:hypothetical protein [Dolichospermum circinale CS-545/17]
MPAPQEFHDSTLYFIRSETAVIVHEGGLRLCSSDSAAWRKPYYIRRKLFQHPLI